MSRVLGLVASSCGEMERRFFTEIAEPAAALGWQLAITLTPAAKRWLESFGELKKLQGLTDLPVRSTSRLPGEPRPHPDPEVFLFAPASANSVAKLALGIADNQALTVLGDVLGDKRVTVAVGYQVRDARIHHPAWRGHLTALESAGVRLHRLNESVTKDSTENPLWTKVLDLLPAV